MLAGGIGQVVDALEVGNSWGSLVLEWAGLAQGLELGREYGQWRGSWDCSEFEILVWGTGLVEGVVWRV